MLGTLLLRLLTVALRRLPEGLALASSSGAYKDALHVTGHKTYDTQRPSSKKCFVTPHSKHRGAVVGEGVLPVETPGNRRTSLMARDKLTGKLYSARGTESLYASELDGSLTFARATGAPFVGYDGRHV